MMNVYKKIKIEFILNNTSGAAIARRMDVDRTAIYHVLKGKSRSKRLRKAIADAIGKRVDDFWPPEAA